MVVETDLATELSCVISCLRIVLGKILPPVILDAGGCVPRNSCRTIAAAGADDEVVSVGKVELASFLHLVRTERLLADVRTASDKPVVLEHLVDGLGVQAVVTGHFHALVANLRDSFKRLIETDAAGSKLAVLETLTGDVCTDGVELHGNLCLRSSATERAASRKCRSRDGGKRRSEERTTIDIHFHNPFLFLN